MELWFYHLQSQMPAAALPKLLERAAARGWRVVVEVRDENRLKALDDALWSFDPESFLAHAPDSDPRAASQPVVLARDGANPNGAAVRVLTGGAAVPAADEGYARVIVLFDGNDAGELATARGQWSDARARGLAPTYWKQNGKGGWAKGP